MLNSIISDYSDSVDISMSKPETMDNMTKESNYIKFNIEAYNAGQAGDYQSSIDGYLECLNIAKDINDTFKINDATCNYATALFYGGSTKDSIKQFEEAYQSALDTYNQKNLTSVPHLHQLMKIGSNMTLAYLAVNKPKQSLEVFYKLLEIINKETSVQKQGLMLKSIIIVFFRIDSIISVEDYTNTRIDMNNIDGNEETVHHRVMKKIISAFHCYLKTNDIQIWIETLNDESTNLKQLKDYSGLIFAIFNQQACLYIKCSEEEDGQGANNAKSKLSALLKAINSSKPGNDKNSKKTGESNSTDSIVNKFKERIETAKTIYQNIYSKEKELKRQLDISNQRSSNDQSEQKSDQNSSFLVRLLLKYAIKNIETQVQDADLCNQMISQIKMTLDLIEKNEIDLSEMKLSMLDPSIAKSLRILFDNLLYIYGKCAKVKRFAKMKGLIGKKKLFENTKRLKDFFEEYYVLICNGNKLTKINLTSTGKKEHFYRLDYENDVIQVFEKHKKSVPKKTIAIGSIKKILYGIKTDNLKRKLKSITTKTDYWKFMSFVFQDRTIDIYFASHYYGWFYGLKYFLDQCKMKYKQNSTTGFVLARIKMMMASKKSKRSSASGESFVKIFLKHYSSY